MTAMLYCRVCRVKHRQKINHLEQEVQVYCAWKDQLEYEEEMRRKGEGLGFQRTPDQSDQGAEDIDNDVDSDDAAPAQGVGMNSKSKGIKKSFVVNRGKRLSKNDREDDSSEDEDEMHSRLKRMPNQNDDSDSDAQLFKKNPTKPQKF